MHYASKPTNVYRLDTSAVRFIRLSPEEIDQHFAFHADGAGWEPSGDLLKEQCRCSLVDHVAIPNVGSLWVDDEGLLKRDSEVNPLGSYLYAEHRGADTPIAGPALLVMNPVFGTEAEANETFGELVKAAVVWFVDSLALGAKLLRPEKAMSAGKHAHQQGAHELAAAFYGRAMDTNDAEALERATKARDASIENAVSAANATGGW